MGNTTTFGDINQTTAAWVVRESLRHVQPHTILSKLGKTEPLPPNKALAVTFRRPVPFAISTIPLAEGVTPTPQKMSYERVTVQVKQYGNWSEISDVVMDTSEDPVLRENTELIGEQAAGVAEKVIYNAVRGGTNVIYANGLSRSAVNTPITLAKQRAITKQLKRQKAGKITKILDGSPDYATRPIEAAFIAVGHTDLEPDIRAMQGFIPTAEYGTRDLISEYEVGRVDDVRYVLSPDFDYWADAGGAKGSMSSTSGTSADVYPLIFFGKEAFGLVPLKGRGSMHPIVVQPKGAPGDPLAQRGSVGYKFYFAALILNEMWMVRLEVAATA